MNEYLFNLIYNLQNKNKILDFIGFFLAEYCIFLAFLFVFIYFVYKKFDIQKYIFIFGIPLVVWLISIFIKMFRISARPLNSDLSSFPSGHTSVIFALASSFYFFFYRQNKIVANKVIVIVIFIVATLIGISRIYTGRHWPLDILGGAILGFIIPYFIDKYKKKIRILSPPL